MKSVPARLIFGLVVFIWAAVYALPFVGCSKSGPIEEVRLIGSWELKTSSGKAKIIYYTNHVAAQKLELQGRDSGFTWIGHWELRGDSLNIVWDYTTNIYSKGQPNSYEATVNANVSKLNDSQMVWENGWRWSRVAIAAE